MGIGGHILGEKKLRWLCRETGFNFARAYIRNGECQGYVIQFGKCQHYKVLLDSMAVLPIIDPIHWVSCPKEEK